MNNEQQSPLRSRLTNWIAPAIVLLGAIFVMHRRLVFTNFILARGDSYLYFTPYWHAAATALKSWRLPLWNPDLFMGAPLLANSQVGMFYPLNHPLWLLFDAPDAVKASIVLHLFIAAMGVYFAGRKALKLSIGGAIVAALIYALGGYLTAQVEHINQAQSMAWMPWILAVASNWRPAVGNWRMMTRKITLIALLFGLQLLAGHTQTTFITGIGVCIWSAVQLLIHIWHRFDHYSKHQRTYPPVENPHPKPHYLVLTMAAVLGTGVVIAVLIAAVQLFPTLELTGLSRRQGQGGLTLKEVLSFSLHTLLLARALLPGYGQMNYAEYIASVPLTGIILGVVGMVQMRRDLLRILPAIALVVVGIAFGLGEFSPIYQNYALKFPGFDLFRAPARWMVLYALGIAFLAGVGWDAIGRKISPSRCGIAIGLLVVALLIAAVPYSDMLAETVPLPPENPPQIAVGDLYIGWMLELAAIFCLILYSPKLLPRLRYFLFVPLMLSFIFTGKTHQQSAFTSPDAFYDVRPAVARLQVSAEAARANNQPIPRFLSMSKGFFDPGDQGEIDSIYSDQLTDEELYLYTTNAKDREIVVPNLTMIYGLSAIGGFDGGLLPTYDYAETADLILPEGEETVDGRLRELITSFPDARWLDLFGVRHIIADRIGEYEYTNPEGVRVTFDTMQTVTIQPGESILVGDLPISQSTEVWILSDMAAGVPGTVRVSAGAATDQWQAVDIGGNVARATWSEPGVPDRLELVATADAPWTINGVSLVNAEVITRATHVQTMAGAYRTLHVGDVKVYENLDVLPRAFMVQTYQTAETVGEAVELMSAADFDPATRAIVEMTIVPDVEEEEEKDSGDDDDEKAEDKADGDDVDEADAEDVEIEAPKSITVTLGESSGSTATITEYAPEKIVITTTNNVTGLLVLAEAHYPSWTVTIDGDDAELHKVDGMFRGVIVPAGTHEVVFRFKSPMLLIGAIISLVGLGVAAFVPTFGTQLFRLGADRWQQHDVERRVKRILRLP